MIETTFDNEVSTESLWYSAVILLAIRADVLG